MRNDDSSRFYDWCHNRIRNCPLALVLAVAKRKEEGRVEVRVVPRYGPSEKTDRVVLAGARTKGPPTVTGLSPTEGTPGTQITIRGENLGTDQNDILMLFICGTDCLHSAKWKTDKKIVARLGQANRGLGEVKIATKSGGRGICNVKFRVFIAQVGPLEESAVWVDESQTVPGREAVRTVSQVTEERDALGLKPTSKKMDQALLSKFFPECSGNIRMESFNPQCIEELREALKFMQLTKADEAKKSEQMHKANLYSLISCVDSLAALHDELERSNKAGEFAVIKQIGSQVISEARVKAESVFKDVLSRKDRADATRNALSVLTRFKFIFFLSKTIDDNMKKGEYLTILNDYMRAKSLYKDTEVSLFKELMVHLDEKMERFKEEMKLKLIDTSASFEEQSKLIKYLKQMLINTINVSSWLILNALVPKALPDDVIKRYEAQFVRWPEVPPQVNRAVLTQGLKTLRSFISSLLEAQFTNAHVQPLVELCMTVRLKVVSDVIDKGVENICALGSKENWKQDFSSNAIAKTALSDFYENEVFDCLSAMRDALSTCNYPGEACLFSRDRFRVTLIDIFVHLIVAIRHCLDRCVYCTVFV
uniref:Exocyst complex component 2 n=1 Tax=Angiostrongylus cantonensis TaxID=6313 RepID=A0A0K0CYQ4_ANGCA